MPVCDTKGRSMSAGNRILRPSSALASTLLAAPEYDFRYSSALILSVMVIARSFIGYNHYCTCLSSLQITPGLFHREKYNACGMNLFIHQRHLQRAGILQNRYEALRHYQFFLYSNFAHNAR